MEPGTDNAAVKIGLLNWRDSMELILIVLLMICFAVGAFLMQYRWRMEQEDIQSYHRKFVEGYTLHQDEMIAKILTLLQQNMEEWHDFQARRNAEIPEILHLIRENHEAWEWYRERCGGQGPTPQRSE